MLERFQGESGKIRLQSALSAGKILSAEPNLVSEIVNRGKLLRFEKGEILIDQGSSTNDVFFIIAGTCDVIVNGRRVAMCGPGDHVGEMAAIDPSQPRSATVAAVETVVALKLDEDIFSELGRRHPSIYRAIAQELSKRLVQRYRSIGIYREKSRVFIISSREARPVANTIAEAFKYDRFTVDTWYDDCFTVSNYPIQDLENQIDVSDFAIAIAYADDKSNSRGTTRPAPRDNVIFELGLFMGRLGRSRAILMEPHGRDVKIPSDFSGLTTITYCFKKGEKDNQKRMGPACDKLRKHIINLGPNNG